MTSFRVSKKYRLPFGNRGFTFVEVVLVVLILGILAGVTASFVGTNQDAVRYEETKAKMEAIRVAILGDLVLDPSGQRTRFGYHGDMGRLPAVLTNLVSSENPAYAFDNTRGFGSGWRGPYVSSMFTTADAIGKDTWGRDFVYDTLATPPFLRSLGSDGAVGGTVYAKDITITFPTTDRLSTVRGMVIDGTTRLGSRTVEIRYPVDGTQTAFTASTAADGTFSFPNVPFGVRSLAVTAPTPALGPVRIVVGTSSFVVPETSLNYAGAYQKIVHVGPVSTPCSGDSCVSTTLSSNYEADLTLDALTVDWNNGTGYLTKVTLDGVSQIVPAVPAGTRVALSGTLIFPKNTSKVLQLDFSLDNNGANEVDMDATNMSVLLEWRNRPDKDEVDFATP